MTTGLRRLLEVALVAGVFAVGSVINSSRECTADVGGLVVPTNCSRAWVDLLTLAMILVVVVAETRWSARERPPSPPAPVASVDPRARATEQIVGCGIVLAIGAVLIPFLAIAAIPLGIIALTRDRVGAGVVILLLAGPGVAMRIAYSMELSF